MAQDELQPPDDLISPPDDLIDPAPEFADVIRQTERSAPNAISPKGARTEYQVMPATAGQPGYGVKPAADDSPAEITRVGRDTANAMLQNYGHPALAAAAYNAGPGRVNEWLKSIGDPRTGKISVEDWISKIPFPETKDYVTRAMSALGGTSASLQPPPDLITPPDDLQDVPEQAPAGGHVMGFDTPLTPGEETQFQAWKQQYAPNDSGFDYDLRGAFKAGLTPDPATGHWPDTFKKPNHPTFSDQSIYASVRPDLAGTWNGDQYVPPTNPGIKPSAPVATAPPPTPPRAPAPPLPAAIAKAKPAAVTAPTPPKPESPGAITALVQGIIASGKDVGQTFGVGTGADTNPAAQPYTLSDLTDPRSVLAKTAYGLGKSAPTIAGGILGTAAGAAVPVAGETGIPELAGGALGASLGGAIQSLGPAYAQELKKTPNDPDGAFDRALHTTEIDAGSSGISWAAFGYAPFKSAVKNVLLQAFGIQPGVSVSTKVVQNISDGKAPGEGTGQAYVSGAAGTLTPAVGHALASVVLSATGLHGDAATAAGEAKNSAADAFSSAPAQALAGPALLEHRPGGEEPGTAPPAPAPAPSPPSPPEPPAPRPGDTIGLRDPKGGPPRPVTIIGTFKGGRYTTVKMPDGTTTDFSTGYVKKNLTDLPQPPPPPPPEAPPAFDPETGEILEEPHIATGAPPPDLYDPETGEVYDEEPPFPDLGEPPQSDEDRLRAAHAEANRREQEDLDRFRAETEGMQAVGKPDRGTSDKPVIDPQTDEDIQPARDQVTAPSPAQAEAQNYPKGHIANFHGMDVTIETPKGTAREGVSHTGEDWSNVNNLADYGYIKKTTGADGEHVDVYIGPNPKSETAYVIDQIDPRTGAFDEHKAVLGADSPEQAAAIYDDGFSDGSGPSRRADVKEMPVAEFKQWVESPRAKEPVAKQPIGENVTKDTKPVAAPTTRPLDGNGKPIFREGERVVINDENMKGRHGVVSKATGISFRPIFGGSSSAASYHYTVKTDQGTETFAHNMSEETEKPGNVVPDPVVDGHSMEPPRVKDEISYARRNAAQAHAAAGRARKRDMKDAHLRRAKKEEESAKGHQSVLDAWMKKYPEEAAKYFPATPGAAPVAAAEAPKPQPLSAKATYTENEGRDGVEVKFAGRPDDATIGRLKASGFRWSPRQKLWYARRTSSTLGLAKDLAGEKAAPAPVPEPSPTAPEPVAQTTTTNPALDAIGPETSEAIDAFRAAYPAEPLNSYLATLFFKGWRASLAGGPKPPVSANAARVGYDAREKAKAYPTASEGEPKIAVSKMQTRGGYTAIVQEGPHRGLNGQGLSPEEAMANVRQRLAEAQQQMLGAELHGFREVGKNRDGKTLYEDRRGVRSYVENGIRHTEPVTMQPVRDPETGGTRLQLMHDRTTHPEFETVTPTERIETQAAEEGGRAELDGDVYQPGGMPITSAAPPEPKVSSFKRGDKVDVRPEFHGVVARSTGRIVVDVSPDGSDITLDGGMHVEPNMIQAAGTPLPPTPETPTLPPEAANGLQEHLHPGAPGTRPEAVHGTAPVEQTGRLPSAEIPGSPRPAGTTAGVGTQGGGRPAQGRPGQTAGGGTGAGADAGIPGTGGRAEPGTPERPPDAKVQGADYRIEPGEIAEGRGPKAKALDNIAAIELAKRLKAEGRPATREEQSVLARYVGWGGLAGAFKNNQGKFGTGFEDIGRRLEQLLTPEEHATASRSTQYAHYTAEHVIRAMWDAVHRLGFEGGSVFEPGMGIGHFLGMMPPDIAEKSAYQGIEMDHLTADIAKLLYPQSGVRQSDFTQMPLPENNFDLVIGNPPFSDTVILADPKYASKKFMLHDYFFAKSLDSVRPGGLLAFVTSAGTMNKIDASAREYLAERAAFLGGVRLPSTAFKKNAGTEVTTDILFFQKYPGDAATVAGHIENLNAIAGGDLGKWTETVNRDLPDGTGQKGAVAVNRYFSENPGLVLGEEGRFDKLYKGRYGVHALPGADLEAELPAALQKALPEGVYKSQETPAEKAGADFSSPETKDGSFYLKDGRLFQYQDGVGRPVSGRGKGVEGGITAGDRERIHHLIPIRDALRDVFAADLAEDATTATIARDRLNKAYDTFFEKFGPINKAEFQYRRPTIVQQEVARAEEREGTIARGEPWSEGDFDARSMLGDVQIEDVEEDEEEEGKKKKRKGPSWSQIARARQTERLKAAAEGRKFNEGSFNAEEMPDVVIDRRPNIKAFMDDPESYRLRAIEEYNDTTGASKKRRVFIESVLTREMEPEIRSAQDGVLWSMNKFGRLALPAIAQKRGQSVDDVVAELGDGIYRVPGTQQTYQTADEYLSGDIFDKLAEAKKHAQYDRDIERNVAALEAARPAPLPPSEIRMSLGMPWIPHEVIEEFARDHLQISPRVKVRHSDVLGGWTVAVGEPGPEHARWATDDMEPKRLLQEALNRTKPRIYKWEGSGHDRKSVFDPIGTQAVSDKIDELSNAFAQYDSAENIIGGWIGDNPEKMESLAGIYNESLNRTVLRNYDGAFLTTPGVASDWSWRPHQRRVVARIIQAGNTYIAHAVGAGKAQPLDAKVLTPTGWTRMGELSVGDLVIAGDGTPTRITGIYPQGEKEIFRVGFSDGSSTECCDEHLWLTHNYKERSAASAAKKKGRVWTSAQPKVRSLAEIRGDLVAPHLGAKNHSIPIVGTVAFNVAPVSLDPYLMGALLGDATFRNDTINFSSADTEVLDQVRAALPDGCELRFSGAYDYRIVFTGRIYGRIGAVGTFPRNPIVGALRRMGLFGHMSHDKFVPPEYLYNSAEVRLAVLQGLMDTDGWVSKRGHSIYFTSTSERLADGVTEIVRSLGGTTRTTDKQPHFTYLGVRKLGRPAYNVCIKMPPGMSPFRMSRKAGLAKDKSKYLPVRYIVSADHVGRKPAQCIKIAHASELYVTDDFIVTHNTSEYIGAAMEMRRLGLIKKPMFTIPNIMLAQFTKEFYEQYPLAQIMVADERRFHTSRRKQFMANVAQQDLDAVIITHSSFGKIPISGKFQATMINEELELIEEALKDLDKQSDRVTIKKLENKKEKLEQRLRGAMSGAKDKTNTFEEMGIDHLFVDEAHCFPYDALVATDQGPKKIGDIVENGLNVRVASYDDKADTIVWRGVNNRWRHSRASKQFIVIKTAKTEVCCTTNHQVFVDGRGYVRADSVKPGEVMRILRQGVHPNIARLARDGSTPLFSPVREESGPGAAGHKNLQMVRESIQLSTQGRGEQREASFLQRFVPSHLENDDPGPERKNSLGAACRRSSQMGDGCRLPKNDGDRFIGAYEGAEPYARRGREKEDGGEPVRENILGARRQWAADEASTFDPSDDGSPDGVCDQFEGSPWTIRECAQKLQSGLGRSDTPLGDRDRRPHASATEVEVFRSAQDGDTERARVVSVEVLERGSPREPRTGGPEDQFVYDLGIEGEHNYFADGILVHNSFRKLDFASRQNIKGIDGDGSNRAFDLYSKIRYLESKHPGRSIVMGSGTPVTNTMGELYTLSKFMQNDALAKRGLSHFDSWAASFGETSTNTEPTAQGTYERVTRFARFVNAYELYKMVGEVMDIVTPQQLEQYVVRPKVKGGKREFHLAPKTDAYAAFQQHLVRRVEAIKARRGPPKKGDDILLSVINDGRHAAIDMRYVEHAMNDPDSKLNQMLSNVIDTYHRSTDTHFFDPGTNYQKEIARGPATQMIFSNLGVNPRGPMGFSGYDWMKRKLIAAGIPKSEIAFIGDYKSHVARQKLFNDMNAGKVRILVGSTTKMGMGVNAQRRLLALHNLDPLWFPADDEQRIGRGLRQGNWNPLIEIHDYATKGTYDEQMWRLMGNKARFIERFFRGDPALRTMEDLGEASFYEQASAMAASDERVIRLTELHHELERIERQAAAHDREQYSMRNKLKYARGEVQHSDSQIPKIQADIAKRVPTRGDAFKMTVGDNEYVERKDAAEAFGNLLNKVLPEMVEGESRHIGDLGGFRVLVKSRGRKYAPDYYVQLADRELDPVHTMAGTAPGIIRAIEDKLESFEGRVAYYERRKAEAQREIASLSSQIGKPFAKAAEMAPLRAEIRKLERALAPEAPLNTVAEVDKAIQQNAAEYQAGRIEYDEFDSRAKMLHKRREELSKPPPTPEDEAPKFQRMQRPEEAPVFYSALERGVESIKQEKAPVGQWRNMIKNLPGVKKEEIDWTGLDDWLATKTGSLDKSAILDFIRANNVDVREVVKGEPVLNQEETNEWVGLMNKRAQKGLTPDEQLRFDTLTALESHTAETKFPTYTLPGGSNYRELLLTLPSKDEPTADPYEMRRRIVEGDTRNFVSPHWDEPNVLAHVRFDDRVGPNGERILHVAEIQSDWHQRGRREGYGEIEPTREVRHEPENDEELPWIAYVQGVDVGHRGSERSAQDIVDEMAAVWRQKHGSIPDAPFKTTWQELALRRILRYGAEHGYARISFDTGETNAARYDLSKHIDRISVHPISSFGTPVSYEVIAHDKGDRKVLDRSIKSLDELPDLIGKEAADKLTSGENKGRLDAGVFAKLENADLKVGGHGMLEFYDKILPQYLNKYAKKWGAKVEDTTIGKPAKYAVHPNGDGTWRIEGPDGSLGDKWFSKEGAEKQVEIYRGYDAAGKTAHGIHAVHSISITPAMRASVMAGQPLFERKSTGAYTPPGPEMEKYGTGVYGEPVTNPTEAQARLVAAIEAIAKRIIPTANVRAARRLFATEGKGQLGPADEVQGAAYWAGETRAIAWSLESLDAPITMRHEAVHFLRANGLITDDEWGKLEKAAKDGKWISRYGIGDRYSELARDQQTEEAIAEEFGHWRDKPEGAPDWLAGIFEKIRHFLRQVAAAARRILGRDATAEDVFAAMESGEVGRRGEADAAAPSEPQAQRFQTKTPEFKRWFGDSKVADEKGEPLVVYHGTRGDFEAFDATKAQTETGHPTARLGFFFTPSTELAHDFVPMTGATWPHSVAPGGNIVPAYLSVKKPLTLSAENWRKIVADSGVDGEPEFRERARQQVDDWKRRIEAAGFDGIHVIGDPKYRDTLNAEYGYDNWIAFHPTQIKSAIGNRGTFDPNDPRVQYQRGPATAAEAEDALDEMAAEGDGGDTGKEAGELADDFSEPPGGRPTKHLSGLLGAVERTVMFPRTLAATDWRSGRYWDAISERNKEFSRLLHEAADGSKKYVALTPEQRSQLHAVEELDRLKNFTRVDTGDPVVQRSDMGMERARFMALDHIRMGQVLFDAGIDRAELGSIVKRIKDGDQVTIRRALDQINRPLAHSKFGDVIELDEPTSRAYFERRDLFRQRWRDIMAGTAKKFGWNGPPDPDAMRAAAEQEEREAGKNRLYRLAAVMDAMAEQERQGYVPLMRFGDYYLSVTPKAGRDAESLGGFPRTLEFKMIDSSRDLAEVLKDPLGATTRHEGETPKAAQKAIDELRQRYSERDYNIHHGYIAKKPEMLRQLDIPAIEKLLTVLNQKDSEVFGPMVEELQKQMYEELTAGFKRRASNMPGYESDFARASGSYFHWTSNHVADLIHGENIRHVKTQYVDTHPDRNTRRFWDEWERDQNAPGTIMRGLMQFGFYWELAANPSSSIAIALHGPEVATFTLGIGLGHAGGAAVAAKALLPAMMRAEAAIRADAKEGFHLSLANVKGITPAERAGLEAADKAGLLHSNVANELGEMMQGGIDDLTPQASLRRRALKIAGSNISVVDRANRVGIWLAAYRLAQAPGNMKAWNKVWFGNQVYRTMLDREVAAHGKLSPEAMAEFMVKEAAFEWGKANQSWAARKLPLLFQFQGFRMRWLSALWRNMHRMGPAGKMAGLMMIAGVMAIAGTVGIPAFGDIEGGIEKLWKALTGKDPMIESHLQAMFGSSDWGKRGAEMVLKGAPRTALGIDLSSRLGFGNIIGRESTPADALGAVPGILWNTVQQSYNRASRGQPLGAVAPLLPAALRNPYQAAVVYPNEGVRTQYEARNQPPVVAAKNLDTRDLAARALGFEPSPVARAYEKRQFDQRLREAALDAAKAKNANRPARRPPPTKPAFRRSSPYPR